MKRFKQSEAAKLLGINPNTLAYRLKIGIPGVEHYSKGRHATLQEEDLRAIAEYYDLDLKELKNAK